MREGLGIWETQETTTWEWGWKVDLTWSALVPESADVGKRNVFMVRTRLPGQLSQTPPKPKVDGEGKGKGKGKSAKGGLAALKAEWKNAVHLFR